MKIFGLCCHALILVYNFPGLTTSCCCDCARKKKSWKLKIAVSEKQYIEVVTALMMIIDFWKNVTEGDIIITCTDFLTMNVFAHRVAYTHLALSTFRNMQFAVPTPHFSNSDNTSQKHIWWLSNFHCIKEMFLGESYQSADLFFATIPGKTAIIHALAQKKCSRPMIFFKLTWSSCRCLRQLGLFGLLKLEWSTLCTYKVACDIFSHIPKRNHCRIRRK